MSMGLIDTKTLVHIMNWTRQITNHYISVKSFKIQGVLQEFRVLAESVMWKSAIGYHSFEIY